MTDNLKSVSFEDIKNLSLKELNYWKNTDSFKNFEKNFYNKQLLEKVTFKGILYSKLLNFPNLQEWKKIIKFFNEFYQYFIYESNKTEWSRIPFSEVKKLFEIWQSNYKNKNEIQEVINSQKAWNYLLNDFTFTKQKIKKLYHILTKNLLQETGDKYPRWFRKVNVIVWNSNVLDFQLIEKTLDKLLQQYKQQIKTDFPLKVAFDFYLEFEKIHPFENWNWRIWRLLLNKILIQNKFFPMIIFSENKQAHFSAISSTKYNKKKYYKFMLQQYEKTLNKINYE